jgi:hypothetical protein
MRRYLLTAGLLALAPALLAPDLASAQDRCEQIQNGNRVAGTVLGAIGGAVLGSAVAGHGNKTAGALIGGAAGGYVGNQIGGSQNPCPQGYQQVDQATWDLDQREGDLDRRLHEGLDSGRLDRGQANAALDRLADLRAEEGDIRNHNGGPLYDRDRDHLMGELADIEQSVNWGQGGPPPGQPYGAAPYGGAPEGGPPPPQPAYDDQRGPPPPGYNDQGGAPPDLHQREARIDQRIQREASDGDVAPDDARRLEDQLRWIRDQEEWLMQDYGQLRPEDEQNLEDQLQNLSQRFHHVARHQ